MKTVVFKNDLPSSNMIEGDVYKEYIKLLKEDIAVFFCDQSVLKETACPGCLTHNVKNSFECLGMRYQGCSVCGSQYVNPRPSSELLNRLYKESKACQYWRKQLINSADEQLYYIYGARLNWISEMVDEFIKQPNIIVDFGSKYPFLLKHLLQEKLFLNIGSLLPQLYETQALLSADIYTGEILENYKNKVSVFTAFESLERMVNPQKLFDYAAQYCRTGGIFLLTTASWTGFEYQLLKDKSPNLNPINRMNLLSTNAILEALKARNFEIIEFSTPGRLDVEIVYQTLKSNETVVIDSYWRQLIESTEDKTRQNLQEFLQENRLSAHVRIAARKI